jgi:hypothetical protein
MLVVGRLLAIVLRRRIPHFGESISRVLSYVPCEMNFAPDRRTAHETPHNQQSRKAATPHREEAFPRKFVEFPEMKGRTVEKIEVFTTPEYHSIAISFQPPGPAAQLQGAGS